ncbi:MAG: anti-sigma factor [Acidimicrobiia bacterium]|nr:anti-sigma factor [Acidimicrobiia bacterium]
MTCDEARTAMLAGDDEATETHLASCAACQAEKASWRRWRAILADSSTWEEPTPNLVERILEAGGSTSDTGEQAFRRRPLKPWRELGVALIALFLLIGSYSIVQARAPDWSLSLTARAPGAAADVDGWNTETGTRMRLRVSGVDPAPEGHYYEIWLTAEDGRHVSAGTFRDSGTVSAWAGVRRSDFPRIWITLESMDGDLGPSPDAYFDTVAA